MVIRCSCCSSRPAQRTWRSRRYPSWNGIEKHFPFGRVRWRRVATLSLAADERERRFAAVDADSAPIIARFSPEGSLAAPSIICVATARRGS